MKLTLPPGLSPQNFDAAVKALQGAVGADWVMTSDQDRDAYADIYAPGPETLWGSSGAVAPQTVEEIQAIVKIANQYKLPLWTVARGKNLGYGTAAPRMPGCMVLDLGRMNKIHELDATLGYAVLEPGVGFIDLYEEIQRRKLPLMMSVPGNGWGSVLGNALDHGIGYTPYGLHATKLCGMEVVLGTGDLVRTGLGAMDKNHAWNLFPFGYGPTWDLMFLAVQSRHRHQGRPVDHAGARDFAGAGVRHSQCRGYRLGGRYADAAQAARRGRPVDLHPQLARQDGHQGPAQGFSGTSPAPSPSGASPSCSSSISWATGRSRCASMATRISSRRRPKW